jgi:signal transduction histidine kinase
MKLTAYIKSKIFALVLLIVVLVSLALLLLVSNANWTIIVSACALVALAAVFAFAWDFLNRRRFYNQLLEALRGSNESYHVTAHLAYPSFLEGQLTFEALRIGTKDMNDRIAGYRVASEQYRDYVETWIHEIKTPIAATRLILSNSEDDVRSGESLGDSSVNGAPVKGTSPANGAYSSTSGLASTYTKYLQPIAGELDRIESHIEQALYYARSMTVEKDYSIKQITLEDVVKSAVKKQARTLIEAKITPHFADLNKTVYADPKWLDFIIGQIISNAVKYSLSASENHTPTISFSAEQLKTGFDTEMVRLNIIDNGIGIPAADVKRVFDKGFTGENGRKFAKSTGIGLYLCKTLCEKMKLRLSIKSTTVEESLAANAPLASGSDASGKATIAGSDQTTGALTATQPGTTLTIEFPLSKMHFLA